MALNIKDPETDRLARELATLTGQPITAAVREAIEDKLVATRAQRAAAARSTRALLDEVAARGRRLPVLDPRTPEEILGYDQHGLPS